MANEFMTDEFTDVIQKMVREVVNDPDTYKGSQYLPAVSIPARKIRVDVVEANGGLTNEHLPGADPKNIQATGTRTEEFSPGYWKEGILYDEPKILYLRELGQNDRSKRGIERYIELDVDRLNRRLEARQEYLRWQTLINGGWTHFSRTVSFGVPAANRVTPITAVWSSDGINPNNSANPLTDLRYWLLGGYAPYRKYKIGKAVLNPNTARWILDNTNVKSLIQYRFAAENFAEYSLNRTLQFLIPGLPEFEIYDGWYQTESVVNGRLVVSDGQYMLPDGYIFFEPANLPGGDVLGEFVQGVHLAEGSISSPGFGKFLLIEDCTQPGTRGGPRNPFIELLAGVYGGPKLDRPFDVLTAKVIA